MSKKKGFWENLFEGKKSGGCCGAISDSEQEPSGPAEESILILGPGCKNCLALEANVKEALSRLGRNDAVGHVTDFDKIAAYGIMSTPGLVVNGKVVLSGKVLKADAIMEILERNLQEPCCG